MTTPGRTRGHSRDDVVQAALLILDEHGLPDLTMRRLASALGVQPSALYWHFPNKQSMLAELSDRIVSRSTPGPTASEWTARVASEAGALRDALLTSRDGAEVVSSTRAMGLGSPVVHDRLAAAIASGGFDAGTVDQAATALLHFVLGHVFHEQQRMQFDSLGARAEAVPDGPDDGSPTRSSAAEFSFGVGLLVDGLRFGMLSPDGAPATRGS